MICLHCADAPRLEQRGVVPLLYPGCLLCSAAVLLSSRQASWSFCLTTAVVMWFTRHYGSELQNIWVRRQGVHRACIKAGL